MNNFKMKMAFLTFLFKRPKLVAMFAFRNDYHLVPDLLKNLEGFIDDYVTWDDRQSKALHYHEGHARLKLINKAKAVGADWVIGVDPDERFEKKSGSIIRKLIKSNKKIIYGVHFRELFSSDQYRADGLWGEKKKFILFPLKPGQEFYNLKAHSPWHPINPDYQMILQNINLYHLKMIKPEDRIARRDLLKIVDKGNKIQKMGYDYLTDEKGMVLEKIPKGREYYPKYKDSYGNIRIHDNINDFK